MPEGTDDSSAALRDERRQEVRYLKDLLRDTLLHLASVGDGCIRHPDVDKLEDRILRAIR